eukprot:TRINITY_DN2207_c0_g1_i2.p1 TRINITY_DN2207_c0_g1~~TRINITY_DN2207_c0_g1_i2.p1  ORF type:complete len:189 (-),score=79.32 TRINITY_DN2207_c0_g1_i2:114-650(-)
MFASRAVAPKLFATPKTFQRNAVGQSLLGSSVSLRNEKGEKLDGNALFKGKKVVVVGIPGAFTPTCSTKHAPPYVQKADELKQKGVSDIYVVAVNDHHVMRAFGESLKNNGKISFLADSDASFAKTLGLDIDLSAPGLGHRSKRFSLIVNDGKIVQENVEPNPGQADVSTVENILKQL